MSDEDICGHPNDTGGVCQNPTTDDGDPDKCWVPTHNDPDTDEKNPGRPMKFNDDRARAAIEAARQSKSLGGCARAARIDKSTLIDSWLEKDLTFTDTDGRERSFSDAFADARADGETVLVQGGLRNDNVDTSMAKFLLSTSFEYKETTKHELTGEDGGAVEVEMSDEEERRLDELLDDEPET